MNWTCSIIMLHMNSFFSPHSYCTVSTLNIQVEACIFKWFYSFIRDPEIWRQACLKVWGRTCSKVVPYTSWRDMFLERPRVRFDGKPKRCWNVPVREEKLDFVLCHDTCLILNVSILWSLSNDKISRMVWQYPSVLNYPGKIQKLKWLYLETVSCLNFCFYSTRITILSLHCGYVMCKLIEGKKVALCLLD